jgi:hypothetical protein
MSMVINILQKFNPCINQRVDNSSHNKKVLDAFPMLTNPLLLTLINSTNKSLCHAGSTVLSPSAPKTPPRNTSLHKQVVNIPQSQLIRIGKETIHNRHQARTNTAKTIKVLHAILSTAISVFCTTVNAHIQSTNTPNTCPRERIRVVATSDG